MPEQLVDARVWGKERQLARRYPLICHLLDTAAVAGVLWERVLTDSARARLGGGAGPGAAVSAFGEFVGRFA
ncbi:HD domain-containing protein [Streptomyces inhibens]|uniref:HD domain-containing protein n=1 Tax=Streptomyces inhibens TaxID=2293571 RepID=UPI00402A8F3E